MGLLCACCDNWQLTKLGKKKKKGQKLQTRPATNPQPFMEKLPLPLLRDRWPWLKQPALGTVPLPACHHCHQPGLAASSPCPSPGKSWMQQPARSCPSRAGAEARKSMRMVFSTPGPGLCASFTAALCKEPLAHPAAAMAFPVLPCACPLQTLRVDKGWFLFPKGHS